jgi:hypothetical protein
MVLVPVSKTGWFKTGPEKGEAQKSRPVFPFESGGALLKSNISK